MEINECYEWTHPEGKEYKGSVWRYIGTSRQNGYVRLEYVYGGDKTYLVKNHTWNGKTVLENMGTSSWWKLVDPFVVFAHQTIARKNEEKSK